MTKNSSASPSVRPSTDTWPSAIASRSADCVRGEARLISSASRMFVKTGPSWKRKAWSRWSNTDTPRMSEGNRSGVNWIRLKRAPMDRASALARVVLPVPGLSSSRTWPPLANAARSFRIAPDCPRMTVSMFRVSFRKTSGGTRVIHPRYPSSPSSTESLDDVENAKDCAPVADHLAGAGLAPAQHAAPVHDEGRAVRDVTVAVVHAVGADHRAMDVAQERERDVSRLGEGGVAEGAVTADAEQGRAPPRDLVGDLAQVAQLRRSDAAEVVTVEDEHHVGLALEVGQRHVVASRRRQREARRLLAEAQSDHEPPYITFVAREIESTGKSPRSSSACSARSEPARPSRPRSSTGCGPRWCSTPSSNRWRDAPGSPSARDVAPDPVAADGRGDNLSRVRITSWPRRGDCSRVSPELRCSLSRQGASDGRTGGRLDRVHDARRPQEPSARRQHPHERGRADPGAQRHARPQAVAA